MSSIRAILAEMVEHINSRPEWAEEAFHEDTDSLEHDWLIRAMAELQAADHQLVMAIQGMLNGTEWDGDTLDKVAQALREAGYEVGPVLQAEEAA